MCSNNKNLKFIRIKIYIYQKFYEKKITNYLYENQNLYKFKSQNEK